MKQIKKEWIAVLLLSSFIAFLIFWKFFLSGTYPFPGNFMLSWYEPWKSDTTKNSTITIAHKAIADDAFRQLYPFRLLNAELLKKWELPLWNPYNGSGMPLFATMHAGFLNPFNILFVILPGYLAWSWYIILQLILVIAFTYLYCRRLGLNKLASTFTSLVFALSGYITVRLLFGEYIYVISMLPLLLYLAETYLKYPRSRVIYFLPLVIFFIFVSGQPQMILYVLSLFIAYFMYRFLRRDRRYTQITICLLLTIVGIGLAAIQLFPTLELFQNAGLSTESSRFIFERFLLSPSHLVSIAIPNYFGNQGTYNYWGPTDYIETIAAVGLIPIFFALLGFGEKNKQKSSIPLFYLTAIILSIILTLDWFVTRFIFSIPIPILSTGIPSRIFVIATFSISILAGYGFNYWIETKYFAKFMRYAIVALLITSLGILGITFLLFYYHFPCPSNTTFPCRTIALRNTFFEVFIFLVYATFFLFSFIRKLKFTHYMPHGMIILFVIIGTYNSQKVLPFSPKETFLPENELIHVIQEKTENRRVFGFGSANIKTDFATLFKFYDPNYYDPLYNKRYGELIAYANSESFRKILRSDVEIKNDISLDDVSRIRRDRLFNILSVGYFIFKKEEIKNLKTNGKAFWNNATWEIRENQNSLPRVFLTNSFEVIPEKEQLLKRLFDSSFDPLKNVLLEQIPHGNTERKISLKPSIVTIKTYEENKVSLETSTSSKKLLVLTDNYFPGWKALIDDKETPVYRANYTFRAIIIPSGNHMVKFSYEPLSLKIGIIVSLISFLIYLFLIWKSVLIRMIY